MNLKKLLLLFVFLISTLPLRAVTLEELAGVYIGKRTETTETSVTRYDEIDIFAADGLLMTFTYIEGQSAPYTTMGYIDLAEDGSFVVGDGVIGYLRFNGAHLEITIDWPAADGMPATTVEIKAHRVKRLPVEPPK